ncbi:MAG TPA: hypothetical protein EYN91_04320 [Candidatus Melainabacteria bacterium]|nr:hypothetical protein [Candidatus Melainabacteria bacterium]HIN66168.1 hypothetical protein [Candidatus Obscuribacterales bacterium]
MFFEDKVKKIAALHDRIERLKHLEQIKGEDFTISACLYIDEAEQKDLRKALNETIQEFQRKRLGDLNRQIRELMENS